MTPEEMNRRIAELCGWKWRVIPTIFDSSIKMHLWELPDGTNQAEEPDYCQDRNAVAEMEEAIEARGKVKEYTECLSAMFEMRKSMWYFHWDFRTATPRQCVEACLRAFGLWEE